MTKKSADIFDFARLREERRPQEPPEAMQRVANQQVDLVEAEPGAVIHLRAHRHNKFVESLSHAGLAFLHFLHDEVGMRHLADEAEEPPEQVSKSTDIRAS